MNVETVQDLKSKKCQPCEGGVPPVSPEEARRLLTDLDGWELTSDGQRIRREWVVKNFLAGVHFLDRVAELAEAEDHHPDLHLTGYRQVQIELTTHAIGGLSENDFIMAVKINELPVEVKTGKK